MGIRDALDQRIRELNEIERVRREDKITTLARDLSAEKVSLEQVGGRHEVAILDDAFVLVEIMERVLPGTAHRTGPGTGEYTPGERWILRVARSHGELRLEKARAQNLEDLAHLAAHGGAYFAESAGVVEAVLAVAEDEGSSPFWYNLTS